jgi:hypothetical protein
VRRRTVFASLTLTATVIEIGRELLSIKDQLGHGRFGEWVEAECGFTQRSAENYIKAARFAEGKNETVSDLPPALVYHLASKSAPPEIVDDVIARLEKGKSIDQQEVEAKLHEARRQQPTGKSKPKLIVEAMRRLRSGGTQVIRVEKIEVSDTAQAIVGNINSQQPGS